MIKKAYKYRLYPNKTQEVLLQKHFGCVRFIYNWALDKKIKAYKADKTSLSEYDLIKEITPLKKLTEYTWLKEVSIYALQQSVLHMGMAYKKFFREKKGFPKFKSKHNSRKAFSTPAGNRVDFIKGKLYIPKFREGITCEFHRTFEGIVKTCTVNMTPTSKYFVSILVETPDTAIPKQKPDEKNAIGIDLGIKSFAVTSNGETIENPKYLRDKITRLKILQRRASKKQKGSANRKKANLRIAKQHEKITNRRADFLHKLTRQLITENQGGSICLENLNISGMLKNHCLAQAIADVSWQEFNRMIEYKADWFGVNILRIGTFEPSSKTCSCGFINKDLKLSDRIWTCSACGTNNLRDELAAKNIKRFAFHPNNSGPGRPGEPAEVLSMDGPVKQEIHTLRYG